MVDRVAALRSKCTRLRYRRGAFYMRPSVGSRLAGRYGIRPCVFVCAKGANATFFILYYFLFIIYTLQN